MKIEPTGTTDQRRWRKPLSKLRGMTFDATPLRESRDLRLLFAGQAINIVGSQVRMVTIAYLVYVISHSNLLVGLISLAQFVPAMVFSLVGGALADVVDRRRLLIITQVLLATASGMLTLAAFVGTPQLWYIFVIVSAAAGVGAFDQPTRRAVVPRLASREQLANAQAINSIILQLGFVLGPAIAGAALAAFGTGPTLLIDTTTFGASLLSLLFMAPMPRLPSEVAAKRGLAAIIEGLAFLKDRQVLLSTFLIDVNAMFFGGPKALFPALALTVFKVGPRGLGLLYAAPGAGAFAAACMSGWVGRVRYQGRAVVIAVCVWGTAIAAFGLLTRAFWLALLMLAIAFAADEYSAIFRATILQLAVPDRLRGRLSSVHFMVVMGGPQLGNFEAGAVAALTSVEFSVVSGGLAALAGAVLVGLAIPVFMRYDATTTPVEA